MFRRLAEREHYHGPLISVATATIEGPGGEVFQRDVVHHPGAVSVVPVLQGTDGPVVVMLRQYRAAVDSVLLEIPAGTRDVAGEAPEETARRELAEEVGLRASRLELLAEFYNSPGFCDEHSWVFLACDLGEAPSGAHSAEERHMSIVRVPLGEVPAMVARREIVDAKTIIGLCLARERITAGPEPKR